METLIQELKKLNLTEKEARVYLAYCEAYKGNNTRKQNHKER